MQTFEPLAFAWPAEQPDALVATSARAWSACQSREPPETFKRLPLFLVGSRTEQAARRHGFAGSSLAAADSDRLLLALVGRPPQRLLYLAGRSRKPDLEAGLAAAGHRLAVLETYAAAAASALVPEAAATLGAGRVDGVLHYSRRSAEIFLDLCARAGVDPAVAAHLCLSGDVAAPLRAAGCPDIRVAGSPDEAAMIALAPPAANGVG